MNFAILNAAAASLLELPPQSVLIRAILWVENLALGSVATTVAVLAVAMTGMLLLSGRIDLRRGATVMLGCFILFGARSIAQAFQAESAQQTAIVDAARVVAPEPPVMATQPPQPRIYDPYAGASTPQIH